MLFTFFPNNYFGQLLLPTDTSKPNSTKGSIPVSDGITLRVVFELQNAHLHVLCDFSAEQKGSHTKFVVIFGLFCTCLVVSCDTLSLQELRRILLIFSPLSWKLLTRHIFISLLNRVGEPIVYYRLLRYKHKPPIKNIFLLYDVLLKQTRFLSIILNFNILKLPLSKEFQEYVMNHREMVK